MTTGNARALLSRSFRCVSNMLDDGMLRLDGLRQWASELLWLASIIVDPDTRPCPGCGERGGAHLDCDLPGLGYMTAAERREAFPWEDGSANGDAL